MPWSMLEAPVVAQRSTGGPYWWWQGGMRTALPLFTENQTTPITQNETLYVITHFRYNGNEVVQIIQSFVKLNLSMQRVRWNEGNTLAPSCGVILLEVQQQLRQDLFKVLDIYLVTVFGFSLFQ